jgi:hypothetical protein
MTFLPNQLVNFANGLDKGGCVASYVDRYGPGPYRVLDVLEDRFNVKWVAFACSGTEFRWNANVLRKATGK